MTQTDYENKKGECWKEIAAEVAVETENLLCMAIAYSVFDRAYALGKKIGISDFSDAEGEEMLTVSRKQVQKMYADIINDIRDYNGENPEMVGTTDPILRERAAGMRAQLRRLFGSKCLPDETKDETKNDTKEPKYALSDKVTLNGCGDFVISSFYLDPYTQEYKYRLGGFKGHFCESDLEPYTEPEEESRNYSQETANCDKQLDNILKDSFRKHNRLHVASIVMAGMLAGPKFDKEYADYYNGIRVAQSFLSKEVYAVKEALSYADALIAECELSEKQKGE